MKIEVWWVGKTSTHEFLPLIKEYKKRITRFHPVGIRVFAASKHKKSDQQKTSEGTDILKQIKNGDHVILLDEKGNMLSSKDFATFINKKSISVSQRLIFIIGGAHGFSDELYARANELQALSKMTFTHEMVRIFFLEQLYRAFTIIQGHPYHNS